MNKILSPKFGHVQTINTQLSLVRCLYALYPAQCMQEKCEIQTFHINHAHLSLSQTTQEEIFPGPSQLQKLNQFKLILASGKNLKNLKFPTFNTIFTHFYCEFLKDFYIFRISGSSGSFWYKRLQDSSGIS